MILPRLLFGGLLLAGAAAFGFYGVAIGWNAFDGRVHDGSDTTYLVVGGFALCVAAALGLGAAVMVWPSKTPGWLAGSAVAVLGLSLLALMTLTGVH